MSVYHPWTFYLTREDVMILSETNCSFLGIAANIEEWNGGRKLAILRA